MIFSTFWFLAAAALFLPCFWLAKNPKLRLTILIAFCFVFHAHFAGPAGVLPIIILGAITYFAGLSENKIFCKSAITLCVLALVFYKYTHLLCVDLVHLVSPAGSRFLETAAVHWLPAFPPLAISFFTFEFVHYLIEVCKGNEPIRKPTQFVQFAFYYPSLVAGPIKRYAQFLPSLELGLRKVSASDAAEGLLLVAVGFFKKTVLADNLTAFIDMHGPMFNVLHLEMRWLFLVALALRIYMDFSGYTDMAIGFSRLMGIELPKNFNWPYVATSIQDFWQRWHISLSTWIRDYVYIPLGGSRVGTTRRISNGLIAFSLCGLWHGASWNFLVWGLYHGVGLAVCSTYRKLPRSIGTSIGGIFDRVPTLSWALTMMYVGIGWLFFFYPVEDAIRMTGMLFRV
jgi:alginate O-acetyltransferase complex protein AlgI